MPSTALTKPIGRLTNRPRRMGKCFVRPSTCRRTSFSATGGHLPDRLLHIDPAGDGMLLPDRPQLRVLLPTVVDDMRTARRKGAPARFLEQVRRAARGGGPARFARAV